MRIALDALGSDNCPDPEVQAAVQAAAEFDDDILLVGPEDQLRLKLSSLDGASSQVEIINAPEAITMEVKVSS
jgi:glycerol-3-phosphate acyltransferase PlsX